MIAITITNNNDDDITAGKKNTITVNHLYNFRLVIGALRPEDDFDHDCFMTDESKDMIQTVSHNYLYFILLYRIYTST